MKVPWFPLATLTANLILGSVAQAQSGAGTENGLTAFIQMLLPLLFLFLAIPLVLRRQRNTTAEYMKRGYSHMEKMEGMLAEILALLKEKQRLSDEADLT